MISMRIAVFGAPILAAAIFAQAPGGPASDPARAHDTKHLTVTTSTTSAANGHVSLVASITPKPTMHVYAPGQSGLIGVTLTLDANAGVKAGTLKYPEPEKRVIAGETELVYSQPFRITDDVTLTHAGQPPAVIKGTLRYQACDDVICYLPATVPLEWTIK